MFDVSISIEDNNILGGFIADSYFFEPSKYDYAYYLYNNDKKADTAWYSQNMQVVFELKDMTGVFYIKVYVRDIEHGDKRIFNSKKINIS